MGKISTLVSKTKASSSVGADLICQNFLGSDRSVGNGSCLEGAFGVSIAVPFTLGLISDVYKVGDGAGLALIPYGSPTISAVSHDIVKSLASFYLRRSYGPRSTGDFRL